MSDRPDYSSLLRPKAVLLALVVCHGVALEVMNSTADFSGTDYHMSGGYRVYSLLLTISAASLLLGSLWGNLIAVVGSGWVVYRLGVLWLLDFATPGEGPLLGWPSSARAWSLIEAQPHFATQLLLALSILVYAIFSVSPSLRRRFLVRAKANR